MLTEALKARLPVLRATTSDTVNLPEVIKHLVPDRNVGPYTKSLSGADIFITRDQVQVTDTLYSMLADKGQTLLLINQDDDSGIALNVGEVPVPQEMMLDLLREVVETKKEAMAMLPAFRGLTLKAASELISLTTTIHKKLTIETVLQERSRIVGKLRGLSLVDTDAVCYLPNKELARWVKSETKYFHNAKDERLIPRGLLFGGPPGVGKSQGAKYVARTLGVPLYRLDMGSVLGKFVGESEAGFSRVLSMLDQEEPCVFLIDEVEKLFESGSDDAGVTSRILSQLLWWGQEHTSRILTIMTTNNRDKLPPELYRYGRIDRVFEFGLFDVIESRELATQLCQSFGTVAPAALIAAVKKRALKGTTPAIVTQMVYDYLKGQGEGLA